MKDTELKKFKILEVKIDKLEFKLKEVVESTGNNVPRIKCVNCDYSSTKHIELEKHTDMFCSKESIGLVEYF